MIRDIAAKCWAPTIPVSPTVLAFALAAGMIARGADRPARDMIREPVWKDPCELLPAERSERIDYYSAQTPIDVDYSKVRIDSTFNKIAQILTCWRDAQAQGELIAYADRRLAAWDPRARNVGTHERWIDDVTGKPVGGVSPIVSLARYVTAYGDDLRPAGELARLLRSSFSRHLIGIRVSRSDVAIDVPALLAEVAQFELVYFYYVGERGSVEGMTRFFESPSAARLEHLAISLNDATLRALRAAPFLPQLETLSVAHTLLRTETLRSLFDSSRLEALRDLSIAYTFPTTDDIATLASAPALRSLEHLDLSATHLDHERAVLLAQTKTLTRLRSLCVTGNDLSAADLELLRAAPAFANTTIVSRGACPRQAYELRR